MDGMDGLAAGMAVIGFSCYAIMGWLSGNWQFAQSSLVVAAASAGFLFFNFPPARIFMGDVGSSTLGLLAAAFSLWGVRDGVFPFWAAILIFSPFIADASVTLVRRMIRGEKIWQAHKTHYYQKLAQAGWGHRKTALTEYAIMVGCGVTALSSQHATVILQMILLAGWVLFYVIFFPWVSWYSARRCHGPL
jgi:UDP-N-acetylmuramyl pentapeptide phosphotransferase/UDP-N-acetylglucosamine-1-phosphate transferase